MSNVGRPSCQLWFEKNKPDAALPKPSTFTINMLIGDIVEAVFKGLLTEAGVKYEDSEKVSLDCGNSNVSGTYDLILDGAVDDIKSARDSNNMDKLKGTIDALNQEWAKLSQDMYSQSEKSQEKDSKASNSSDKKENDNIEDADFEVVDEK